MSGVLPICQPCAERGEIHAAAWRCTEHELDLCEDCTLDHVAEDAEGVDA